MSLIETTDDLPRAKNSSVLRTQAHVLWALILHDIKSRFFGNGLGYLVTIIWPAVHIVVVLLVFLINRRSVPYGTSALLYASTAVLPYIIFNYVSRFTMLGLLQNRSFLSYPIINVVDMLFARIFLETITCVVITYGLALSIAFTGVDVMPLRVDVAAQALFSAWILGVGFGIFNGIIGMVFPLWNVAYIAVLIISWATCGIAFDPETLPVQAQYWLSWFPLMHSVEWLRSAYYMDFPAHILDKSYILYVSFVSLTLGLALERVLRLYIRKS